ncbi:MAG TPA: hypothetical protein VGK67_01740 [Myxococcales bacterium]
MSAHHQGARIKVVLGIALVVGLVGVYFVRARLAGTKCTTGIASHLHSMKEGLASDSYAGYRSACEHGEKIVRDFDPALYSAHAYLAYAYAIRWGEHGDATEALAKSHLAKAQAAKMEHSHLAAAETYIQFFGGDRTGAVTRLAAMIEENKRAGRKSTLLTSVLGIIQMRIGDLENAYKNLKAAQTLAPADLRINAALCELLRRQGSKYLPREDGSESVLLGRHTGAQLDLVQMAIEAGKWQTAEKYARKVLTTEPPPSPRQLAVAHVALAVILDHKDLRTEADKEQTAALELRRPSPDLDALLLRRHSRSGADSAEAVGFGRADAPDGGG